MESPFNPPIYSNATPTPSSSPSYSPSLTQMSLVEHLNTFHDYYPSLENPSGKGFPDPHTDILPRDNESGGRLRPARPSCLSRSLSTRSASSTSSTASNRSVRFTDQKPKVQYTYPKEVYDRASIRVDKDLVLKRCSEEEPRKWVECFIEDITISFHVNDDGYDESHQSLSNMDDSMTEAVAASSLDSYTGIDNSGDRDILPSLSSDTSDTETSEINSCLSTPVTSPATSFEPIRPATIDLSTSALQPFFMHGITSSPVSYSYPQTISTCDTPPASLVSSKDQPNFVRWDIFTPHTGGTSIKVATEGLKDCEPRECQKQEDERAKEKRRLMHDRLRRMRERSKQQEDAFGCLGGF